MNAPQGRPPMVPLHSLGTTVATRRGELSFERRRHVCPSDLLFSSFSFSETWLLRTVYRYNWMPPCLYDFLRRSFCRQPPAADRDQRSRHARFITIHCSISLRLVVPEKLHEYALTYSGFHAFKSISCHL